MAPEDLVLLAMVLAVLLCAVLVWRSLVAWRDRPTEPGTATKLLFSVLVTALCATAMLLALEIFYRFAYDATDSFALLKTSQRWFDRHYQKNSWGLRDDVDYAVEKTKGRRRVTFVGDSFTVGHGVKNVADRFANRIRAAHPEWDVQVLAVDGVDTGGEITALEGTFARGYQTDDVVLVYCLNDIGDLIADWSSTVAALYDEMRDASFLVRDSFAVNHLYFRLRSLTSPEIAGYFPALAAAYAGPLWDVQAQRLERLDALVKAHGARLVAVTFPFLHALGPAYPFAEAHRRLDALWTRLGVPHVDLLPRFAGREPSSMVVNANDSHPNEAAHAIAAAAIDAELVQLGSGLEQQRAQRVRRQVELDPSVHDR